MPTFNEIKSFKQELTGKTTVTDLAPASTSPGTGMWFPMSVGDGPNLGVIQSGSPLEVPQDIMIGVAGAIVMEKLSSGSQPTVGFIGTGDINKNMARGAATVRPYKGLVFGSKVPPGFAKDLPVPEFKANDDLEPFCGECDVIFTEDSANATLEDLETCWFKDAALIIHYGDKDSFQEDIISSSRKISKEDLGAILNGDEKVSEDTKTKIMVVNLPNEIESFMKKLPGVTIGPAGTSPGTGMWFPMSVGDGSTLGVIQSGSPVVDPKKNDIMIGVAGAIVMEKLSIGSQPTVGFIGTGDINKNMARGAATVRQYDGLVYGSEGAQDFADELYGELGERVLSFNVDNNSLQDFCGKCDVIFTEDTSVKLQTGWFKDAALIINYGEEVSQDKYFTIVNLPKFQV